ncbi:MAG TPA: hypothetical protein VGF91_10990 [Solirubrobacteraceae bacterium]|jgi:hypothetical protein
MSLARLWRRQLLGASSAALIVPSAMLAALVVLALGGGLSQVGVLGQIFAGPSLPATGGPLGLEHSGPVGIAGGAGTSLPVISAVAPALRERSGSGAHRGGLPRPVVRVGGGAGKTGGAISPTGGGTVRPVTQGTGGGSSGGGGGSAGAGGSSGGSPSSSAPQPSPSPQPQPHPQPTPVDTAVKVVTSVTQQLPGPAGAVATQVVQAAGAAADNLLPVTGRPAPGLSVP